MGIYIQVENITTDESKRFGPYEAVHPDLMIDEGNGWAWGPVQKIKDSVDIIDDDGEPYSYVENVRVEGEDPTYWHNCYIVSEPEYLYALDEQGGFYLFLTLEHGRRALDKERKAGLQPGLFRIPVPPETYQEFATAVANKAADEHPIVEAAVSGELGDWQPIDTSTHYAEDRTPAEKVRDSIFNHDMEYTDDPTMLRISREHNGDWTLDGINEQGQYTEATISYESLEGLLGHVEEFIETAAPGLKDPVTYQTKYLPIVTATHDEQGNVISVEVDWNDSQQAVEQLQEDGSELDEGTAENLGMFFDKWVDGHPQAASPRGHWYWEVGEDG